MRIARVTCPAAALGILLALPASAEPERIQFAKGQSSAVLAGMAPGMTGDYQGPRDYVLRASAGQQMTVNFNGEDAWYAVLCPGPGTTDAGANDWAMTLPESGDYRIRVSAKGKQDAPYSLTVGVVYEGIKAASYLHGLGDTRQIQLWLIRPNLRESPTFYVLVRSE